MTNEPELLISELSQPISSGGKTVNVEIYRQENEEHWTLELEDEHGNSTVWDETFESERLALTEAKKAILEEKVTNFIGPADGKSDGTWR